MIISETNLVARYAETDRMGIVHHSNYPIWFEIGRTDFIKKLGFNYSKIEEEGILLPLTGLKCSFKSPARYEDELIVRTRVIKMSCVRLTFGYEVLKKEDMSLVVSGETLHAWTDKNLKPLNISKKMPELYVILNESLK
jgi:acyl-CoA thioester hydrolase